MLLGLRTAIYPVADIAKAREWYSKVVGKRPYFDQPFYVGFEVGGFELALGAALIDDVTDAGGGIKVGAVLDPFGNRLGFIENPGFDVAKAR